VGKLQSLTYPSQARIELAYDSSTKRLAQIVVYPVNANGSGTSDKPVTVISQIGYTAWNAPATWRWGDNRSYSRSWDTFARPKAYPLGDPDGTGLAQGSQRKLDYDDAGRISTYTHFNSGTPQPKLDQSFDYDGLNRLTQATSTATVRSYRYDDSGNRTQLNSGANSYTHSVSKTSNRYDEVQVPSTSGTGTGVVKRVPQYDEAGHLKASGSGGLPIAYTASYSDRGRMDSLSTGQGKVNYRYNALGQRISKSGPEAAVPTGAAHYVYDEQGHLLGEYDAKGNPLYEVVWLNDQPLAVIRQTRSNSGGNLKVTTDVDYIYADHLDTPRVIVRGSGDHAIVWRWDIAEPFGNGPADDNPNKLGRYAFNLRLPGQVFDSEAGLHYNHHRDYDAYLGRYLQSDPIGLAGGINPYQYVEGQPTMMVDPLGLKGWYCQRPLGKPPGTQGPPLFNHQYLCVTHADGTVSCGGLTTDGNPLSGEPRLTRPDEDYYEPKSCKEVDDDKNQCFEQCVVRNFGKPNKPRYGIGPLTDCQEYADDLYYGCKMLCNMKESTP
jgi:RHS repeat-associated protein